MIGEIIYEQVEYLLRHISGSHGPDPNCRECARAEALRMVCYMPFEVAIYKEHNGESVSSAGR